MYSNNVDSNMEMIEIAW